MKPTERTIGPDEKQYDESLSTTHEKKIYLFTKEEIQSIRTVETMSQYLIQVAQKMAADTILQTLERVGVKLAQNDALLHDSHTGELIVYLKKDDHK